MSLLTIRERLPQLENISVPVRPPEKYQKIIFDEMVLGAPKTYV